MNLISGLFYWLSFIRSFSPSLLSKSSFSVHLLPEPVKNVFLFFSSLQNGTDPGASHDLRNVASTGTLSKEEREGEREREREEKGN